MDIFIIESMFTKKGLETNNIEDGFPYSKQIGRETVSSKLCVICWNSRPLVFQGHLTRNRNRLGGTIGRVRREHAIDRDLLAIVNAILD
jgi:hypothetical protein